MKFLAFVCSILLSACPCSTVVAQALPGVLSDSWVGNSIADRGTGLRVPTMLDRFGVWPDGRIWLESHYNEGGAAVTLLDGKSGTPLGALDGIGVPGPDRPDGSGTVYYLPPDRSGLHWHGLADRKAGDPSDGYSQYANHWTPDGLTAARGKLFPEPFRYRTVDVARGGDVVWVADATDYADHPPGGVGRLWLIDAKTRQLLRPLPAPGVTTVSAAADDGRNAWYVSGARLRHVDDRGKSLACVTVPGGIRAVAALPDGGCLTLSPSVNGVARWAADGTRKPDLPLRDTYSPGPIAPPPPAPVEPRAKSDLRVPAIIDAPQSGLTSPGSVDVPVGVGVDAANNLYVACADAALPKLVRVDRYPPDGSGGWDTSKGVRLCWGGTFGDLWRSDPLDPTLRWSSIGVCRGEGAGQQLLASTFDLVHNPNDPRLWIGCTGGAGRICVGVRVLGGHRFLYTAVGGDWDVYRVPDYGRGWVARCVAMFASRDVAIEKAALDRAPAGIPRRGFLWHDANDDNAWDAGEYETWGDDCGPQGPHRYGRTAVDEEGNVWSCPLFEPGNPPLGPLVEFPAALDRNGNPAFSSAGVRRHPVPQASLYAAVAFSGITRSGDLWILGKRGQDRSLSLAFWPAWVTAGCPPAAGPAWVAPDVADRTRANADWSHWERSAGSVDAAGDYVFLAEGIEAAVRVYRRSDGSLVGRMPNTPLARNSTLDETTGFEAVRLSSGEYRLTVMGYLTNCNVVRTWRDK